MCCRHTPSQIAGQRIGVFSYGSGFAATLYSLRVTQDHTPGKSDMGLHEVPGVDAIRTYRHCKCVETNGAVFFLVICLFVRIWSGQTCVQPE